MRTLALAFLVLAACEKKDETKPVEPAKPATNAAAQGKSDEDTIVIGEVGSLTGSEAGFGISTRNGIELAVEEANAAGGVKGKKLLVRVYDDQSKPEEARSADV